MIDTNEAYKPSQRWILLVGLGSLVWVRLKTVCLTTILGLENNNYFPTLKSLPAAAKLPVISQSKLLSTRHRPSARLLVRPTTSSAPVHPTASSAPVRPSACLLRTRIVHHVRSARARQSPLYIPHPASPQSSSSQSALGPESLLRL